MWKNGSTAMIFSSSRRSAGSSTCATFATRLRCVSMTPFDVPVVPDEYGSATTSSGSTGTCSARGAPKSSVAGRTPSGSGVPASAPSTWTTVTWVPRAAASAVSRNSGIVTSRVAPASTSWWCTSRSVYVGLIVVMTPPASATPWKTTAYSGRFGAMRASTSPLPKPRAANPPANERTPCSSAAYDRMRPVGPSTRAGLSPSSRARCSTYPGSATGGISTSGRGLRWIIGPHSCSFGSPRDGPRCCPRSSPLGVAVRQCGRARAAVVLAAGRPGLPAGGAQAGHGDRGEDGDDDDEAGEGGDGRHGGPHVVRPVQHQLDADDAQDDREAVAEVHEPLERAGQQEVQGAQAEEREGVRGEDQVGIVGDAVD